MRRKYIALMAIFLSGATAFAQSSGGSFTITSHVAAGGGCGANGNGGCAPSIGSGSLTLDGTVAEPGAADFSRNPPFSLRGGFSYTTLGNIPTAAPASITGRITAADGSALAGVVVRLGDARALTTITDAGGNYHFDNLASGSFYSLTPSRANYRFGPTQLSFSLIANKPDAIFTATPDLSATANPLDTPEFFVRQQYLDFLDREPDQSGFEYWSYQINRCSEDQVCLGNRRIDVSNAFFFEREYQLTAAYVHRVYKASFGQRPTYARFMPDRARVIGGSQLDQSKTDFADAFVTRPEFTAQYPTTLTPTVYVDLLNANTGNSLSQPRRDALVNALADGTETRGSVLKQIADNSAFIEREYNASFVLTQYFGYLRRDPDQSGFDFWLEQVNRFPIRSVDAQHAMVCSFITSAEYQLRFSSVVTHMNAECPH